MGIFIIILRVISAIFTLVLIAGLLNRIQFRMWVCIVSLIISSMILMYEILYIAANCK